ncbi:MAG: ribonuclease T [Spirochaetia bacterium]|nr:ribonuclease T [Spirochaetia bacterium]
MKSALIALTFAACLFNATCKPQISGDSGQDQAQDSTQTSGVPESGSPEFHAKKACPAFQSKNKKTNPGNIETNAGKSYEFVAFNRQSNPDWVQVRIPGATPAERWVEIACGEMHGEPSVSPNDSEDRADRPDEETSDHTNGREQCQLRGGADDHTFAVSWQPAFCELKSNKRECKIRDPQVYQAKNFTLHGLWPNKKSCGTSYGFCKGQKKSGDFCQYDKVDLTPQLKKNLSRVMPSVAAGSCLERYEWYKHGLCQTTWNAEQYFSIAVRLTEEFNKVAAPVMAHNVGGSVKESDFYQEIDASLGPEAHKRLQLKCQKGDLIDIYIKLPKEITNESSLRDLIQKAKPEFRSNCGGKFAVDEIND